MINDRVKPRGRAATRVGVYALSLLAVPINASVVQGLSGGPRSLADVRGDAGSPPHTTLRDYLRALAKAGVIERRRASGFGGGSSYELTASGHDLVEVAESLSRWLRAAPGRPIELGDYEAKNATRALVEAWSASMARALAARPFSLTELDNVISALNYPSLERRLTTMRQLGLVEACSGSGRSTPYRATEWLRRGVAPLVSATHWERRHLEDAPLVTVRDVETAFLLSMPLLRFPSRLSGTCRAAIQTGESNPVGVMIELRGGRVRSCTTELEGRPDAWALGSSGAWLAATIGRDPRRLELGGDRGLAIELVEQLHDSVCGHPRRNGAGGAARRVKKLV